MSAQHMKYILSFFFVAFLVACNNGKEKNTESKNSKTDTAATNSIAVADTSQKLNTVSDTMLIVSNHLIVPGKSIGLTSIDQKADEAMKHLGPPAMQDAAMGKELATWYSIRGKDTVSEMNIFFVTNMGERDEAKRVNHIRITSSFFTTAMLVGTGSGMNTVRQNFPGIKKIASYTSPKTKNQVIIYDDNNSGIAFEIENGICTGITVHKSGEMAYETYNALFSDVQFY